MSVTYQADRATGRARIRSRSGDRDRARTVAAARRHSRRVRVLRVVLPLCGIATASLYFLSTQTQLSVGDHQFSVGEIALNRDTLRMVNAKLEGADGDDGAYHITADYAEQDLADPSDVHLTGIEARIDDTNDGWSHMTAPKGTFDTKDERLTLFDGIDVKSSSGMTGRLIAATVDMKAQRVHSEQPVSFLFLNGKVDARSMEIAMDERVIVFTDDVRVEIRKRPEDEAPDAAPDAPPDKTAAAR